MAIALLLPILVGFVWFNFTVDRAGYFQGDAFVRDIAKMLLDGKAVSGYEQMDERQVSRLMVQNMNTPPGTIALGSSRILQMNKNVAGTSDFFNFGMVGADYMDIMGTYYLLQKADKLPQNIIIGFDPWYLNDAEDALDKRSDKKLYNEFLSEVLGRNTDFRPQDDSDKYKSLLSIGYFQGNVKYYFRDKKVEKKPQSVVGNMQNQVTEIKEADGSVLYTKELRNITVDDAANMALQQAGTFLRMGDYLEPSDKLISVFTDFLKLLRRKGINVVFVLQPYNPVLWDNVCFRAQEYEGFFKTEAAVRKIAEDCKIPVYGSYNPYALEGVDETDFYDGIHIKREELGRIFPGLQTAVKAYKSGDLPTAPDYTAKKPKI